MRLLIHTQIVDRTDPTLGFFHQWIAEFAAHADVVHVVCLKEGEHALPANVFVHSLGKESNVSKFTYLRRFYTYLFRYRHEYDAVFVHMNPEYVILGGIFWRLLRKRIALWYAHGAVTWRLRAATYLAHMVFTASRESFRLTTLKMRVMGHGITESVCVAKPFAHTSLRLISVGRLSPVKNHRLMFDILEDLSKRNIDASLALVGAPARPSDRDYVDDLRSEAKARGLKVEWLGGLPHSEVAAALCTSDVFLNCSDTGSLDKAVLEGMAVGLPVVTSNGGLQSTFADLDPAAVVGKSAQAFGDRIAGLASSTPAVRAELALRYRTYVSTNHSLSALIARMCAQLTKEV